MFNILRIFFFLFLGLIFEIIIFGLINLITFSFGSKFHYYISYCFHKIYLFILGVDITVNGNINHNLKKNYIIISNHYTALDYFIIKVLFPNSYTISKNDLLSANSGFFLKLFFLPFQYLFFNQCMLLSYKRGNTVSALKCQNEIIQKTNNHNILIFPEGTSTKNGVPKSFKKGLFYTAYKNNIPILPISLKYKKNIGINPGDKLNLNDWINEIAYIEIHSEINPENFNNLGDLHKHSFEIVTKNL